MGAGPSSDAAQPPPDRIRRGVSGCLSRTFKRPKLKLTSLDPTLPSDTMYACSPRSILVSVLTSDKYDALVAIPFESLELAAVIGKTKYGDVQRASYHGTPVLVKYMPPMIDRATRRLFADDLHLLVSLRHPNIVQCIGASWSSPLKACFVMEYLDRGDLFSLLRNPRIALSWHTHLLSIAIGTARGLAYMHGHSPPLLHRNLKSTNIRIGGDYCAKISGFALRRDRDVGVIRPRDISYVWMSPEMLRGDRCTHKTDVYSFGIVLAELDTRATPYHDARPVDGPLLHRILNDELRPTLSPTPMESLQRLYRRCVAADPRHRPRFEEILDILETDVYNDAVDVASPAVDASIY
ncbi:TKL/DRK protein kinase [Saprolegnia parasitica CBS 223.65]|uniref:TKL/DRK protein kinase n=1 Tax=Saprolegnia parasitica (strain CBS 223.65) TaxID=695850 RepID=A0A067BYN4_SAPPC|nr:TKL/DRK protein kinase [Saprolegnia parasitica CBS 223.65]KDO23629.1 TKL/DRK protein kinase [Saprolegnia parasitica CBS 223.65]|eukprot:XP_012205612.1 TKL/DRK protein kinase [Saprolegnia parasitica CBS 223.65]